MNKQITVYVIYSEEEKMYLGRKPKYARNPPFYKEYNKARIFHRHSDASNALNWRQSLSRRGFKVYKRTQIIESEKIALPKSVEFSEYIELQDLCRMQKAQIEALEKQLSIFQYHK